MSKTKNATAKSTIEQQPSHEFSYENSIAELETIVSQMETGQLALADSLNAYQRGTILLQVCQQALSAVEQQVRVLTDTNKLEALKPYE
ncbi:MAG: exodeoxyribonuclease VII small subunit [Methylophilaceae bacterium]|nr:exodeoxyribonuclease VII small subunit [Methylophilaceae bacterium]